MLIQRLRDGSEGILGKVLIGVVLVIFALFGFGSFSSFNSSEIKVASVNGVEISQREIEYELERTRRVMLSRGLNLSDIEEDVLRQNLISSAINKEVLKQVSHDWNMHYPDPMIDAQILETEAFKVNGVFDPDNFKNLLASAGYTVQSFRDELRSDSVYKQLSSGVSDSSFLTENEARRINDLLSQKRQVAYIEIGLDSLSEQVEISEEEVSEYYEKNRKEFLTEEAVALEYVELKMSDFVREIDIDLVELNEFFNEVKSDYQTEETRNLSHIFIELSEAQDSQAIRNKADEIYERLVSGDNFENLANEFSEDPGSNQEGGNLGYHSEGTFDAAFEKVAFNLDLGKFSTPIEVAGGIHIVKVLDIKEAISPSLEDIRAEVEEDFRNVKAEEEFYSVSNKLSELLFENPDLSLLAANLNLTVNSTEPLTRSSDHFLFSSSEIVEASFSADVLVDQNNSDLIEVDEGHMVGLRVAKHIPGYQKKLEAVSNEITAVLIQKTAEEQSSTIATEIIEAISEGSLAQYVADQYGYSWETLGYVSPSEKGIPPEILEAAFKIARPHENKESLGITEMVSGASAIIRISDVESGRDDINAPELIAELKTVFAKQRGQIDMRELQFSLRGSADIERTN